MKNNINEKIEKYLGEQKEFKTKSKAEEQADQDALIIDFLSHSAQVKKLSQGEINIKGGFRKGVFYKLDFNIKVTKINKISN